MRVNVIGTVAVTCAGQELAGKALGGRRAQVALVVLALAGGPVPADRLVPAVWPGQPPPTWPAALRGVIGSLRSSLGAIGAGGQRVIVTTPAGYALAAGVEVDLRAAPAVLRLAGDLASQGRHQAALDVAEPITGLSGERLLGGEDAPWLAEHRAAADAISLQALDAVATSAGALGDHDRAIAAGRRAVAAHPLDERAHRVLIRALHRGGDRGAVVRAYEACRSVLADQLGVDPAPETVETYLAALGENVSGVRAAKVPLASTAFFGRAGEAGRLAAVLAVPGLTTVTGRGGVGKSRLVAHVAAPLRFPGGTTWVSLGSVSQDELVASTVAMSAGLPVGAEDAVSLIAGHLAPLGRALLVLDGCEAVIDGTASLVSSLVALCPTLSVVVTTRVPLADALTAVIQLEPLPHDIGARLLADRVRSGGGQLARDESTAPFIAELCQRCGGLPLALELAAAQLSAMSVADLVDHLPELMHDSGDRLRTVVAASYALLSEDAAAVFRGFGLLDGEVSLPLARAVLATGSVTPARVARLLHELVAHGLLVVDRSGPRWRYHQDDDVHRLARELLEAAGEDGPAIQRLADAVSAIVPADPQASPEPYLEPVGEVLAAVRSLLGAAVGGRLDRERGLELAFRLHRYWAASNVSEGRYWLSRLLSAEPPATAVSLSATAHATYALGYLDYWSGNSAAAARELSAATDLLRGQPDLYAARALIYLGGIADDADHGDEALEFVRRAIEAVAPFGTDLQVAAAMGMGCVLAERADTAAAGYAADAIELCRRAGSAEQLAMTLPTAAMVCWQVGELDAARGYVAEAMPLLAGSRRIARVVLLSAAAAVALADGDLSAVIELGTIADADAADLGIERELPLIRSVVARALLARGDTAGAARWALGAIGAARELTFTYPLAVCLETAALVCLHQPDSAEPARLLIAAAGVMRERGDRPGPPSLVAAVNQARASLAGGARGRQAQVSAGLAERPPGVADAVAAAMSALAAAAMGGQPGAPP